MATSYRPTGWGRRPGHHPDDGLLMDYASGATSEAESLILAAHLTLCSECRRRLALMEAIGGSLLDGIEPVAVEDGCLDTVMARLDDAPADCGRQDKAEPAGDGDDALWLPRSVRRAIGGSLDAITWKPVMRGLDEAPLATAGDAKARLMRIRAGAAVPQHTHDGTEMTLVLAGGFADEEGHFERGDIAVLDAEVDHRPVADAGEDCICLVVTTAPLRLTGPVGRLLNPFVRF